MCVHICVVSANCVAKSVGARTEWWNRCQVWLMRTFETSNRLLGWDRWEEGTIGAADVLKNSVPASGQAVGVCPQPNRCMFSVRQHC